MKLANLEAALHRRPFKPFEIRVDGETILIHHPDHALFADGKTTLVVVDPRDQMHILEVGSNSKIRFPAKAAPVAQAA